MHSYCPSSESESFPGRRSRTRQARSWSIPGKSLAAAVAAVALWCSICCGQTMYMTDSISLFVRTGPTNDHPVIATLEAGDIVQVLEDAGEWVRIRFAGDKEGWTQKQLLAQKPPSLTTAEKRTAQSKNDKERISALEAENKTLRAEYEQVKKTLTAREKEYQAIQEAADDFLRMKEEHQQALAVSQKLTAHNHELTVENQVLKDVRNVKWFIAGSLVTISSWLVGFLLGRARRKQKSGITFALK